MPIDIFGWFRLDVKLATAVLKAVIPGFTGTVTQVVFEHAPARGNPQFTNDYTAFDVLIRYVTDAGRRGFVAIEVKYSESCQEPIASIRPRYDELSRDTGLFIEHDSPYLRTNPLQQFWREHCLAQVMVSNGLYDEGYFMLVAPRLNHLVQSAAGAYSCQLNEPDEGHVPFVNVHLEDVITAMNNASAVTQAAALHRRYTDFWIIDGEIELALSAMFPKDKKEVAVPKAEKKKRKAA